MQLLSQRLIWVLLLALLSLPAFAQSLDQAKSQGLVGEQLNGYVGIVTSSPSSALRSMVTEINQQRRALYQRSAKEASVSLEVFEARAGQRLQERAKSGEFIQDNNGQWRRK
ncbi:YdbL family protein [Nitrincola schmidtii]|uniref:YdbL family protein n=1 Tax=Nitrincola schmidtii TaxID=1730894 RepID=UPI00124C422A|nr:YdbL family protein [Nitrincola schmidtii]